VLLIETVLDHNTALSNVNNPIDQAFHQAVVEELICPLKLLFDAALIFFCQ